MMSKDISLNSQEWSDIVFDNRNKAYGAYEMRLSSSKRHIWAFVLVFILAVLLSALPVIVSTVRKALTPAENLTETATLADLTQVPDEPEEQPLVKPTEPPPPLKSTIQFTEPQMVKAEEIDDANQLSQDKLADTKEQISLYNVEGVNDINAIDKAELDKHVEVGGEVEKIEEPVYGAEQQPEYPGGLGELNKYLAEHIKYPMIAQENGIEGKTTIRFVVEKDGSITDVIVLKGFDDLCDKEAVRVVKEMPKWQAGRQNGKPVRVYYTVPVTFTLRKS